MIRCSVFEDIPIGAFVGGSPNALSWVKIDNSNFSNVRCVDKTSLWEVGKISYFSLTAVVYWTDEEIIP